MAHCDFTLQPFPAYKFRDQFVVIDGSLKEILLGSPFLNKNDVMFDYREKILRIVDQVLFLGDHLEGLWKENPDSKLCESAKLVGDKNNKTQSLERIAAMESESSELGTIPGVEMKIKLIDDQPIISKPYPIPERLKEAVNNELERLLEKGIIRKARSTQFASPAFPIQKKNGDIRLVVDYRRINKITQKEAFPFPNVREQLQGIPRAKIFSQLDLKQGYHQIKLAERSKKFTAFVLPQGHFEYNRIHSD